MKYVLLAVASATVVIIFFIILFIFMNGASAIREIGIINFLTGFEWRPSTETYGAMPLVTGTALVTLGAIMFALPLGLGSAIFISEVAPNRLRNILKPICEVFAGIPSVVYGFFGLIFLVPLLRGIFPDHLLFGTSWLAGSIILGIMALPTIISVSEDAMRAVPRSYREASMALGATKWETTRRVVVPAAISGIAAATILGIGRAIGETMAVMMVTGNSPIIPDPLWNIFEMLRTITATLALEMPDVVSGSTHYSALFLLALVLMVMVLLINYTAKMIIKRSRKKFGETITKKSLFDKVAEHEKVAKHTKMFSKMFILACLFAASFFISSMFADAVISLIVAMLATIMFAAIMYTDKIAFKMGRSLMLTALFISVYMAASLFVDASASILISFVFVFAALTTIPLAKKMLAKTKEKMAHFTLLSIVAVVVIILLVIVYDIVSKGLPALSLDFLFGYPEDGGLGGGIFPAIVGTIQLVVGTMMIAFPLGIISGIYLAEYAKDTRYTKVIREAIDILNGTPSVVFGLFGMAALVIILVWDTH